MVLSLSAGRALEQQRRERAGAPFRVTSRIVATAVLAAACGASIAGTGSASTGPERLQPSERAPQPRELTQGKRADSEREKTPLPENSASDAAIVTVPPITGPAEIRTPPANVDPGISATEDIEQYNREKAAKQQQQLP